MRTLTALIVVLGSMGAADAPAADELFRGVLNRELRTDSGFLVTLARDAQPPDGVPIPAGASLFSGSLLPMGEWQFRVLLVEPGRKDPFIFIDVDRNGAFDAAERFSFRRTRNRFGRRHVRIALPPPSGSPFRHIPLELLLADQRLPLAQRSPDQRYLLHASRLYATAKIPIDGRTYFFRYQVRPDAATVDLRNTLHAVDSGRVEDDLLSPWRAWATPEPPVFRIGRRYVSTAAIDPVTRTVTVKARSRSEYRRLELYPGLTIPEFAFVDIDGGQRRLSEFRGRYVLLNFWYGGCSPCTDEIPYLRAALERYGVDNLVVVGFSQTAAPGTALPSPGWVQATPDSVRLLIREWFQIDAMPTAILLDRDGRVLSLGKPVGDKRPLRGAELSKTLARVMSEERRR